jgi:hypothetical protein
MEMPVKNTFLLRRHKDNQKLKIAKASGDIKW